MFPLPVGGEASASAAERTALSLKPKVAADPRCFVWVSDCLERCCLCACHTACLVRANQPGAGHHTQVRWERCSLWFRGAQDQTEMRFCESVEAGHSDHKTAAKVSIHERVLS